MTSADEHPVDGPLSRLIEADRLRRSDKKIDQEDRPRLTRKPDCHAIRWAHCPISAATSCLHWVRPGRNEKRPRKTEPQSPDGAGN